ncbi:MAG: MBL fold metallo-hydrolase [Clostridiales bacterium]|nr:MBL fold metallo-hydrolase [Clostridiales bacterium]
MIELISVMDNAPSSDPTLCSEHALSAYLNYKGIKILFDTGQSEKTWENAESLGLDLADLSAIILSHAHYDHTTGLRTYPGEPAGKTIYLGQYFFDPKYSQTNDEKMYIGSHLDRDYLSDQGYSVIEVKEDMEIYPGLHLITNFNRPYASKIPKKFVRDHDGEIIADSFPDEIALVVEGKKGLHLILGCSHPGILNIIHTVKQRFNKDILTVFGGAHLMDFSESEITETIDLMVEAGISSLALSHCTGQRAIDILAARDDIKYLPFSPGMKYSLGDN